jgi:excisionase family DNA binding protein
LRANEGKPIPTPPDRSNPCYRRPMPDSEPAPPRRPRPMEPRFLTLEDVATYLNVSVAQAYALVRSGELPAIKIGGRGVWRVDKRELEAYVDRLAEETRAWARNHPLSPRQSS